MPVAVRVGVEVSTLSPTSTRVADAKVQVLVASIVAAVGLVTAVPTFFVSFTSVYERVQAPAGTKSIEADHAYRSEEAQGRAASQAIASALWLGIAPGAALLLAGTVFRGRQRRFLWVTFVAALVGGNFASGYAAVLHAPPVYDEVNVATLVAGLVLVLPILALWWRRVRVWRDSPGDDRVVGERIESGIRLLAWGTGLVAFLLWGLLPRWNPH